MGRALAQSKSTLMSPWVKLHGRVLKHAWEDGMDEERWLSNEMAWMRRDGSVMIWLHKFR